MDIQRICRIVSALWASTVFCTNRIGILADCGSSDRRHFCKRGCGFQLCSLVWSFKHQFRSWYGYTGRHIGKCRVWTTQCVLSDDFLPTIYSMYGGSCNDTQGIRKHTLDVTVRNVSVGGGMDSDICSLSSWDFSVR